MNYATKALIFDDQGRILTLFRSETHPTMAFDLDLPGGDVDEGETVEEGLIREIHEETGLFVDIRQTRRTARWQISDTAVWDVYQLPAPTSQVQISWEHHDYRWMSRQEFIDHPVECRFISSIQDWLKEN